MSKKTVNKRKWTARSRWALEEATRLGYVVNRDGSVTSPFSGRKLKLFAQPSTKSLSYYTFTIKGNFNGVRTRYNVRAHRVLAYQKFGDALFEDGIEVRHLDDDWRNNSWDNIGLGTHYQNSHDQPLEKRQATRALAGNAGTIAAIVVNRLFTDDEEESILRRYERGSVTYDRLAVEMDIGRATVTKILRRARARRIRCSEQEHKED